MKSTYKKPFHQHKMSNIFLEYVNKFFPHIAFVIVCFLLGTSYAVSSLGYKVYDNVVFISMRMVTAFLTLLIVFLCRLAFSRSYRAFIRTSFAKGDTSWWKSMILGLTQYGFPHSMTALGQRSVSSTLVTVVQPLVPTASLLFASIFLPDERFTWMKLIPHVIALIGCAMTCVPPFMQTATPPPEWYDMLMVFISVLSFGFGSVFYKMFQVRADFNACCVFQLLGSSIYAVIFALIWAGPEATFDAWFTMRVEIIYPIIIGVGYTATTAAMCVYLARKLGAVKSQLVNFGQLAIGVIAGVVFLGDFKGYTVWMQAVSYIGVVLLVISTILGFYVDHTQEVRVDHENLDLPQDSDKDSQQPSLYSNTEA